VTNGLKQGTYSVRQNATPFDTIADYWHIRQGHCRHLSSLYWTSVCLPCMVGIS